MTPSMPSSAASQSAALAHVAAHLFHARGQIVGPTFGVDSLLEGVEDADAIARGDEAIYGVRADKAGTACD